MRRLVQELWTLPQIEQDVLTLCAWEDLSPREAAVALGIPEATVRSRLHRARKRLREPDGGFPRRTLAGVPRLKGEGEQS